MKLWDKLRCAIGGHVKWAPPNQDPDGYKLLFMDFYDCRCRVTWNLCARCGAVYGAARHIPDMQPPPGQPYQSAPEEQAPWPDREGTAGKPN